MPGPIRYGSPGSAHGPYIGCPVRIRDPQNVVGGVTMGVQLAGDEYPVWLASISFSVVWPVVVHGVRLTAPVPNLLQYSLEPPAKEKPDGPFALLATKATPLYGSQMVVRSCMTMSPAELSAV